MSTQPFVSRERMDRDGLKVNPCGYIPTPASSFLDSPLSSQVSVQSPTTPSPLSLQNGSLKSKRKRTQPVKSPKSIGVSPADSLKDESPGFIIQLGMGSVPGRIVGAINYDRIPIRTFVKKPVIASPGSSSKSGGKKQRISSARDRLDVANVKPTRTRTARQAASSPRRGGGVALESIPSTPIRVVAQEPVLGSNPVYTNGEIQLA